MKYKVKTSKRFDKDFKRCIKRGCDMSLIGEVMQQLSETGSLPASYHPHKLSGTLEGLWECHIQSDWLLIWDQNDKELTLLFMQTGTHSDLY